MSMPFPCTVWGGIPAAPAPRRATLRRAPRAAAVGAPAARPGGGAGARRPRRYRGGTSTPVCACVGEGGEASAACGWAAQDGGRPCRLPRPPPMVAQRWAPARASLPRRGGGRHAVAAAPGDGRGGGAAAAAPRPACRRGGRHDVGRVGGAVAARDVTAAAARRNGGRAGATPTRASSRGHPMGQKQARGVVKSAPSPHRHNDSVLPP